MLSFFRYQTAHLLTQYFIYQEADKIYLLAFECLTQNRLLSKTHQRNNIAKNDWLKSLGRSLPHIWGGVAQLVRAAES